MTKAEILKKLSELGGALVGIAEEVEKAQTREDGELLFEPDPRPGVRYRRAGGVKPVCAKVSRADYGRLRKMAKEDGVTLSFAARKLIHRGLVGR